MIEKQGNETEVPAIEKTGCDEVRQKSGMDSKEILELKDKIKEVLIQPGIPDIKTIFGGRSIEVICDVLVELLEKAKDEFNKDLEKPLEEVTFDLFIRDNRLDYLYQLLNYYEKVKSSGDTRKIIEDFMPLYVDFQNMISYSKKYYEMQVFVRDHAVLDDDQRRLLDKSIKRYELLGIHLPKEKQDEVARMNLRISELEKKFGDNVLDSENSFSYLFESADSIKDMPEENLSAAREKAKEKGLDGWLFTSDYTSYVSVMKYCSDPAVRRHFEIEHYRYASYGEYDNRKLIIEILQLKNQKAKLLGYANHAELSLSDKIAGTPEEVMAITKDIAERARKKGEKEIEELKSFFGLEKIEQWDLKYYSRIYEEKKNDLDMKEVKKYFGFEQILRGFFDVSKRLFDLEFVQMEDAKYDPEVRTYKVVRNGECIAYFMLDPFYRENKESGASAGDLRGKFIKDGRFQIPVVTNVSAYEKGTDGKTLLDSWDASTVFHEGGHALHVILSESRFHELSGFGVEWDFIELFSQLMENWFYDKDSMKLFALHHETNEPMCDEMLDKLAEQKKFMSGNTTLHYMKESILDMMLHMEEPPTSVEELDQKCLSILRQYSILEVPDENKLHASFGHIFSGGYDAGFYSYHWAEIYAADVFQEFKKNGLFDKETAQRFLKTMFSQGARKPGNELFFDFMGRKANPDAYYENLGL